MRPTFNFREQCKITNVVLDIAKNSVLHSTVLVSQFQGSICSSNLHTFSVLYSYCLVFHGEGRHFPHFHFFSKNNLCASNQPQGNTFLLKSTALKQDRCCTVWTLKLTTSRVDFLCLTFHHSTASTTPNSSNCFLCQKDIDHLLPKKNIRSITWPLYLVHILVEVFCRPTVPRRAYIEIHGHQTKGHLVWHSFCCQIVPMWARVNFAFPNFHLESLWMTHLDPWVVCFLYQLIVCCHCCSKVFKDKLTRVACPCRGTAAWSQETKLGSLRSFEKKIMVEESHEAGPERMLPPDSPCRVHN